MKIEQIKLFRYNKEDFLPFYESFGNSLLGDLNLFNVEGRIFIMKKFKDWTDEQIQYLKENYKNYPRSHFAERFNKTLIQIQEMVNFLKIHKTKYQKWTPERIKILEDYYPDFGSKKCSELLGVSQELVIRQAAYFKIKFVKKSTVTEDGHKICNHCLLPKPLDCFSPHKTGILGVQPKCKTCLKKLGKEWREANKAQVSDVRSKYYHKNKEKLNQKNKKWRDENKEEINSRRREINKNKKDIVAAQSKKSYQKHREKRKEKQKKYYQDNKIEIRKRAKLCYPLYKEKRQISQREYEKKRQKDPNYRIKKSLRARIRFALKGIYKSAKTMELVGCSIEFLREYISNLFTQDMSWENYGVYGWHIDHIIPCDEFDLIKPEEQRKCFHYSNLQPLWATTKIAREHGDLERDGNIEKSNKVNDPVL